MKAMFLICCALCGACAGMKPTPPAEPLAADSANYANALGFKGDPGIENIRANTINYEGAWKQETQAIRDTRYYANELSFVGAIATAIAGIRQSTEGVMIGGGTAALASTYSSHYSFTVQVANYVNARKAMRCVRNEIDKVDMPTWNILFDSKGRYLIDTTDEAHRDVASVPEIGRDAVNDIIAKLEYVQDAVVLAVPQPSALRDSYTNYTNAQQGAGQKANAAKAAVSSPTDPSQATTYSALDLSGRNAAMARFQAAVKAATISEETWKKLLLVGPAIKNCVALAGGGS